MRGQFQFLKARYVVELTGLKAKSLKEFREILEKADATTLFYHVYHPLLASHLVPYEYPNDFSYWFSDSLQDKDLAEQTANISLPENGGLEELREILLSKLSHPKRSQTFEVRPGNEFDFVRCRIVVFPAGTIANSLDELADGITQASELSIFYHLVTSRLFKRSKYDDFSEWILANTKYPDLAERIRKVDPTTHMTVKSLQEELELTIQKFMRGLNRSFQ
jgi:hypothetical protein